MNRRLTPKLALALAFAAGLAFLVPLTLGWFDPAPRDPAPLAGTGIGGPFALIDQNGRPFTDRDLKGHYALVYFGYTFCPDVCPLDTQAMSAGLSAFEKTDPARGAKVVPVFITIDPERDTPAALKAFAANFHPRLVALSGSRPAIDAAKKAYRIYAKRAGPAGASDYLMDHMAITYLMGPDGQPIAFTGSGAKAADITAELARYVR